VPSPNYDVVLFDLDGTLADTLPLIYEAFDAAFIPALGHGFSPAEIRAMFGPPDHEIIRRRVPPELADGAIERYIEHYEQRHDDLVSAFAGIPALTHRCVTLGMRLGVITGKSRVTALTTLDRLALRSSFSVVYAGDDVEKQKPAPEAILAALADLHCDQFDRVVMVGDASADVVAGKAAGTATIAVTWGSPERQALLDANPDYVVSTVAELEALLVR
jgi:HAD superfamily hydrolase (TIGR01549 family)